MQTRSQKKRKIIDGDSSGSSGSTNITSTPPPVDPPQMVPIPKNPKHIFYDDEDDDDEDYVPPLIHSDDEESSSVSSESSESTEEKELYDDEEEYEDDEEEDEEDEDSEMEEWEEDVQNLDEEDVRALEKLKKEQPKLYDRFVLAKEIIKSRELTIFDILKAEVSDDKRANLIEEYEILRQIQPCTTEYLEQRDKVRNMFFRYIAEYMLPPRPVPSIPASLPASCLRISKSDNQIESTNLRKKLAALTLSSANQKVLEEKLDEFEDIEKGEEKIKIKRWLNLAMQLPFDRLTSDLMLSSDDLTRRLKATEEHLNTRLFGMKMVKERLMLFLNKKLREGGSRGCNIALVGKPGVGKCLHPDTPVRMWDLSVKRAADIRPGDILLGDDSKPRHILNTVTGVEEMFEIRQQFGDSYTVNRSHILSLRNRVTGQVEDIPIQEFLDGQKLSGQYAPYQTASLGDVDDNLALEFGQRMVSDAGAAVPPLPDLCLYWTMESKMRFFSGLSSNARQNGQCMLIPIARTRPYRAILDLLRSSGIRCKIEPHDNPRYVNLICYSGKDEEWFIQPKGEGAYAGFMIDGNRRFVLGDFTVTHNTAIAKSLAECLKIPFAQLSFGGVSNSEFLMGHDFTYIGSRPGEISRCMTRLGVKNGILFFDEFDKATDKKDIMSTLLHVTDFSQNNEFRDSYFPELTQDLSKIWFIYSMNVLPSDPAMLDRLEVIHVDEYSSEERVHIAQEYLFGKYIKELKIQDNVVLEASGAKKLVDYSSGGLDKRGVRELERLMNLVIEKIYFFLSNPDAGYEYVWFNKTKSKVNAETGKVHIDDVLVEYILTDYRKDFDGRHVYLNMYI